MKTWTPDFRGTPPTQEEIDRMAEGAVEMARSAGKTVRKWKIVAVTVFVLSVLFYVAGLHHMTTVSASKGGNAESAYILGFFIPFALCGIPAFLFAMRPWPALLVNAGVVMVTLLAVMKIIQLYGTKHHAFFSVLAASIFIVFVPILVILLLAAYEISATQPSEEAERFISGLSPMDPKHCPEMLSWCKTFKLFAEYQSAVAKQGRLFTTLEYNVAKEVVAEAKKQAESEMREAEARSACLALREPIQTA